MRFFGLVLALSIAAHGAAQFEHWPPIPDPALLRYEGVRKELRLTREQNESLMRAWLEARRISHERRRLALSVTPKTTEERKIRDQVEKTENDMALARQRGTLSVLTPSQKRRLEELQFQISGPAIALNPQVIKWLGLRNDQAKRMRRIRETWFQEFMALPAKSRAKTDVLDAETRATRDSQLEAVLTKKQVRLLEKKKGKPGPNPSILLTNMVPFVAK